VLAVFVFLMGGCTAQQDRIDAARQRLEAAETNTGQAYHRRNDCLEAFMDWKTGQPMPCDITGLESQLMAAIKSQDAAYQSLEAMPGAPRVAAPLDPIAVERSLYRRQDEEDSYASDCNRGKASACVQYEQALLQDREEEVKRQVDTERSIERKQELDLDRYLMPTPY
jgi:hypothetical protein